MGFELQNAIGAWADALKNVPDNWLSRAYEHAADNWPWTDGKAFGPDAVADAYKLLVVEDRQQAEAAVRNAKRREDTYKCFHCLDVGYQPLYYYANGLWYSGQRPCICDATPPSQRQDFPLSMSWVRSAGGEYAKREDIEKYGVPNRAFKTT